MIIKVAFMPTRCLKHAAYLFAAICAWPMLTYAQDYDCTRIPFKATYDPSYAAEFMRQCPDGLSLEGLAPPMLVTPQPTPVAPVGFDERTNQVFVNGFVFDAKDDHAALESEKALDWPLVQLPPNYRPLGPEEFNKYISRAAYRIKNPIRGRIRSYMNRIKNYYRGREREYQRMKKKIEKAVAQCFAIAESKYPGDLDAQSDHSDACVESLYVK